MGVGDQQVTTVGDGLSSFVACKPYADVEACSAATHEYIWREKSKGKKAKPLLSEGPW